MALSDPFGVTAQLGYQGASGLGQGLLGASQVLAQAMQQKKQKQQTQQLLQQLGIIAPQKLTIDDYKKSVEEQTGNKGGISIDSSLPEDQQIQYADKLIRAAGLQPPKPKGVKIDIDKAASLGLDWDPNSGQIQFKPQKQMPSAMQQVQDIVAAQKYAESQGINAPKISETQKGLSVSTGSTGSAGATSQDDIKSAVEGVFKGTLPPERLASWRDVTRVNAEIQRQSEKTGMNYPNMLLEWDATKKFVQNAQSNQQIRLRQAINFAQQSTKDLKELSQEFKRTDFPLANKAQLMLAMNGAYGQDVAKKATIFNQQLTDIVADLGNVYMGGNSPTDEGLKLAKQNLQSNWSVDQLDAAIDNVDKLLTFRSNSIKNAAPMYGGQMGTQYYPQPNVMDTPQGKAIQGGQTYREGQTATNPQSGEKLIYRGGKWQKM